MLSRWLRQIIPRRSLRRPVSILRPNLRWKMTCPCCGGRSARRKMRSSGVWREVVGGKAKFREVVDDVIVQEKVVKAGEGGVAREGGGDRCFQKQKKVNDMCALRFYAGPCLCSYEGRISPEQVTTAH
ncbi:hypothetical protein BT93_L0076 [Corymbia citriodora subsp. variegata]|uniref:Uncharacterized protein n=1 Tax=Corymbia citriodora subsp. variegata TaxID=360336 RepID=A0A8T0CUY2_CORYI|nr:hypothetical protein BT93_L0076 [Corymbia citriodora subsp. variegata]